MNKYQQYEAAKKALQAKNLSPAEYEKEIRKIINRLKI